MKIDPGSWWRLAAPLGCSGDASAISALVGLSGWAPQVVQNLAGGSRMGMEQPRCGQYSVARAFARTIEVSARHRHGITLPFA